MKIENNITGQEVVDNFHDLDWRFKNLFRIKNKYSKTVPFILKPEQKILISALKANKSVLILKSRQIGFSTATIAYFLDKVLFNPNITAVSLSHEEDSLHKIFRIAQFIYKNIPYDYLKPEIDRGKGSKTQLYFPFPNSRFYADLESRSDTINLLHLSELAFFKDFNKALFTMDAVPKGCSTVIETTPNGFNEFYDLWSGESSRDYVKIFIPWFKEKENTLKWDPRQQKPLTYKEQELAKKYDLSLNQIAWRRWKIREKLGDLGLFLQEYPEDEFTCFLKTDRAVFNSFEVSELMKKCKKPIVDNVQRGIKVWNEIDDNSQYILGVDTAEGLEHGDYNVICVLNLSKMRVESYLRHKNTPHFLASNIEKLSQKYKTNAGYPIVAVERNNHGHGVLNELHNYLAVPRIFRSKDRKLGWLNSSVTRPLALDKLVKAVDSNEIEINSKEFYKECMTFLNKKGRMEAEDGKNDDMILSTAIALDVGLKAHKFDETIKRMAKDS